MSRMPTEPENLAVRRKRLRFRSWHRGLKEVDLILGRFADRHLDSLSAAELDRFEALLEASDIDIYAWYAGTREPPAELQTDVWTRLKGFAAHDGGA